MHSSALAAPLPAVFAEAKVLTLSELDIFFERSLRARREADPEYTPNLLLGKAMEYARHFATNHSQESATKIRQCVQNVVPKRSRCPVVRAGFHCKFLLQSAGTESHDGSRVGERRQPRPEDGGGSPCTDSFAYGASEERGVEAELPDGWLVWRIGLA